MPKLIGLLLAAGQSKRFGNAKACTPLANGTAMAVQAAQRLAPHVDQVLCMVRPQDTQLQQLLANFKQHLVPDAALGLSASIKAGVRASVGDPLGAEAWLIALADMPYIHANSYHAVSDTLRQYGGIVAPFHQGQRGHPVGFSKHHYHDLLQLKGDAGAGSILAQHPVRAVTVEDAGVLYDIDTPAQIRP